MHPALAPKHTAISSPPTPRIRKASGKFRNESGEGEGLSSGKLSGDNGDDDGFDNMSLAASHMLRLQVDVLDMLAEARLHHLV